LHGDGHIQEVFPNEYGRIPFIYCREPEEELIPTPDSDMFEMAILLPKILADLNYAIQFQSHSIMYGIDIDSTGLTYAPDEFWQFNTVSKGEEKVTPSIGTITPSVNSDQALNLYKTQFSLWLE